MANRRAIRRLIALSPIHAGLTYLTWRDLGQRDNAQVRGPKRLWKLASGANPVGAVAYWTVGRRYRSAKAKRS
jgi:hypothetical protein